MRVVVPFDAREPKTRLAPVLDATERQEFAHCMLNEVLESVATVATDVEVLSTAPVDLEADVGAEVRVTVDDRPLSVVVNDAIAETVDEQGVELAVVMADLALATPAALARLAAADGDVVLVPGRGVGTNALVVRSPGFRVDFHGASYLDHQQAATAADLAVGTVDSVRLSTDIDEPADLVEAYVHGGPATVDWLRKRFELVVDDDEGRVTLDRR